MKHSIIYENKKRYSSFPLLNRTENNELLIGFFTAPMPDHMGIFWWNTFKSWDEGETWKCERNEVDRNFLYDFPADSAREKSDRFVTKLTEEVYVVTGSFGFKVINNKVQKSKSLFYNSFNEQGKVINWKIYAFPDVEIILTFPRALRSDGLILIPAYALLKGSELSRAFVWRSKDDGQSFRLWNMFPDGVDGNEMAFIDTKYGILAHIRSDNHSWLMESWSMDKGITWSYPANISSYFGESVIGGPSHLLKLTDQRIVCSYGYRFDPMGIRAIVSDDEGQTWSRPIILRKDGGYLSSLHKKRMFKKLPYAGNDVGYPVSVQLKDGKILTAYYITCEDKITHIATTKWEV